MNKDEALKLALELIQDYVDEHGPHDKDSGAQYVITAIKEALAQPEQEPFGYFRYDLRLDAWVQNRTGITGIPFYTTPPQRKPLTDEEIWKFWWSRPEVPDGEDDSMEAEFVAAVRRVLAAHGIKE